MSTSSLPQYQYAVQLVGPSQLRVNPAKPVPPPGPHQLVARVEAVGLCFSDLKLLKQFSAHARKGPVLEGMPSEVLDQIPSYVPAERPTVPGHEVVCRIVAAGSEVCRHRLGERCLVQTDYRTLRTATSNAAFGYNFEGGLQEYVLMDERVITEPESGERFLIPVGEELSASAVALVEPWACVENSYANPERRNPKTGGRLLIVADEEVPGDGLAGLFDGGHLPARITWVGPRAALSAITLTQSVEVQPAENLSSVENEGFDDIIYFGSRRGTLEILNDKIAAEGILNIVTCGKRIGEPVSVGIGRVHYSLTRWIGTTGARAADAYAYIPVNGELRPGERVAVIGAAGPMGQMHVVRNICEGVPGVNLTGTDTDDARLDVLEAKTRALAEARGVPLELVNSSKTPVRGSFSYYALMVPVGQLIAEAIRNSAPGCIINIFAGIPAPTRHELDLDTYLAHRCYMFGTSGSIIRDMKNVLNKISRGRLDTNYSVDAVSGMAGVQDGLAAVENRTLAGKIIVYPQLHDVGLIPLSQMRRYFPRVAEKLENGQWTKAAEAEFLKAENHG